MYVRALETHSYAVRTIYICVVEIINDSFISFVFVYMLLLYILISVAKGRLFNHFIHEPFAKHCLIDLVGILAAFMRYNRQIIKKLISPVVVINLSNHKSLYFECAEDTMWGIQ